MSIPKEIDFGFRINNREPDLWALDIPVEEIDIEELEHNLDIPYLEKEGTDDWNLSPRILIENFDNEHTHREKVEEADTSFPIEIYFFNGSWKILDGIHRYTKVLMKNSKTIKVRRITKEHLETLDWI